MRMLKNTKTGMLYVYHEGLAEAENIEEVQVDKLPVPETKDAAQVILMTPEDAAPPEETLFDASPVEDGWPQVGVYTEPEDGAEPEQPEAPKSLDEMTRDELIAMASAEEKLRGDNRNLSRMKKADLIAYIKGEGA